MRIVVLAQFRFRWDRTGEDWDGPGIWTCRTVRSADVGRQLFARIDEALRARVALGVRRAFGGQIGSRFSVAPLRGDELAIHAVGQIVLSQIRPEIPGRWLIYVGVAIFERNLVEHFTLEVIGT